MDFRYIIAFVLLILKIGGFSQQNKYVLPDSIAELVSKKKYKEVRDLTFDLTRDLEDQEMKYRAIVMWCYLNIDYKLVNSKNGNDVLKRGVAKCAGYSQLVQEMCFHAGINAKIVSGDAKVTAAEVGKKLNFNDHAWNAVEINGVWYLSDVTWVKGITENEKGKEVTFFKDEFFLTDPLEFIKMGHFTKEKEMMFLLEKYSRRKYKNEPRYYGAYFETGHKIFDGTKVKGKTGRIFKLEVYKSDTINFEEIHLVYEQGKDNYGVHPYLIKEYEDKVVLLFDLKDIKAPDLVLWYEGSHFLGVRRK